MSIGTLPPRETAPVVEDPRFQARRHAVEADQRRSRRNRLLALAAVLLGLVALFGLSRSPLVAVNQIQVLGGELSGPEGIKAASGIHEGDQMLDLDLAAARRHLEALPWVRSARVARAWPATVRIVVTERRPVARIADEDGQRWWMADATGRLLDAVASPPEGLVQIDGVVSGGKPGVQLAPRAAAALRLISHFPAEVASRTVGLRFAGADEIQLVINPTDDPAVAVGAPVHGVSPGCPKLDVPPPLAVAELGTVSDLDEKLLALGAVLTQVDNRDLAAVDVRVPDKPVVTRRTSCQ